MIRISIAMIILSAAGIGLISGKHHHRICDVGYIGTIYADGAVTCRRANP